MDPKKAAEAAAIALLFANTANEALRPESVEPTEAQVQAKEAPRLPAQQHVPEERFPELHFPALGAISTSMSATRYTDLDKWLARPGRFGR